MKKTKTPQYSVLGATDGDTHPKCVRGNGKYHSGYEVTKVQVATKQNSRESALDALLKMSAPWASFADDVK